jgi:hypothetical protein
MSTPQHAKIENFELFGMTVRMAPPGLWFYADSYLSAAKAVPLPATTDQFDPARVFLVLRALELALKAFLSLKGRSLAKLAGGPFGHDLASLLARAEQDGLLDIVPLQPDQREEIQRASMYYKGKVFEYPALTEAIRAYPDRPKNMDALLGAATSLVSALDQPCSA